MAILWPALASGQPERVEEADRLAPQTRAGEIELLRLQKSQRLRPDRPDKVESTLNTIKEKKVVERLTAGIAGFRARLGGLTTGSGFAVGPEYSRRDLMDGRLNLRTSARASARKFYLIDAEVDLPELAGGRAFAGFYGARRDHPRIDYYGPGSNSAKSGRSAYKLEDTSFETRAGIRPIRRLRVGGIGQYYRANVGPGRDHRFASTDLHFTEQTTPGIQFQSDFLAGGGFVQYDWRDNPGGPRRGGNYTGQYVSYSDLRHGQYAFSRVDLELQQYIPLFNERRVIALRARVEGTEPHGGQRVPFYLQPTVGGSDDVRGFRPYRFRDNSAIVLNAEYRWEVFSGLDMALFADGGKVYPNWESISLRELDKAAGFGFRFNVRNDVFTRLDTGFSREGFQVWVKFNNVF